VVEEVRKRQKNLGSNAVRFAWVTAHVGHLHLPALPRIWPSGLLFIAFGPAYRTAKDNLQAWRHVLDKDIPDQCRKCGRYAETGKHIALVCIHGEDIGRRWGVWEQMDEPEGWRQKVKDPDEVDMVETFFTDLDLC